MYRSEFQLHRVFQEKAIGNKMSGDAKCSPSVRRAFGARVRQFRKSRGLTQVALAAACELDPNYIGGIERGERNPSLENIARIARALRVPAAQLFAAIDEKVMN